ncbi:hypothetical protein [Paralcaligenes ginsengisoli]
MRSHVTEAQLLEALHASRLTVCLAAALQSPALAIALTNTALAIASRQTFKPRPAAIDHKRRAAGDID